MPSLFITVRQELPPNDHRIMAVAHAHITAVAAPRRLSLAKNEWYMVIYTISTGPDGISVTGSEQELLRLYDIITVGTP